MQVETDGDGCALQPTEPGRLMAVTALKMRTMVQLTNAPSHASVPDLLMMVANRRAHVLLCLLH